MSAMAAMGVYSQVQELHSRLASEQHSDWADRLSAAIRAGATSGEALTNIGVVLDELKDEPWITANLRLDVVRLLDEVDRLLHPSSWVWNPKLSRYEPPGPSAALQFSYSLRGTGWAEAYISDGRNWLRPTASYLSDALRALTEAVDAVVRGRDRVACIWEEEPGNYLWLFEGQGQSVTIEIYWSARGFDDRRLGIDSEQGTNVPFEPPAGRVVGELQGHFATTRTELGFAVLRALDNLFAELGNQGYANKWSGQPFPHREQENLRRALDSAT